MPRRVLLVLCLAASSGANASLPLEASLRDLSCGADHVFIGRVIGVDMINAKGRAIRKDDAMTGPGLKNMIRLQIEVLEVIDTTDAQLPSAIKVSLDPFMHYSLRQIKAAYAEPSDPVLVFLRGAKYEPIIAGRFFWRADAKDEALAMRKECKR